MSDEDGIEPPWTPPDTRLLDERIRVALASQAGGGSGGDDRYEARIAKLEADVSNLNDSVKDIRIDNRTMAADLRSLLQRVTTIEADIKHLPGRGFIVTTVVGALTLFGAVVLFQHQIQQAAGLVPLGK